MSFANGIVSLNSSDLQALIQQVTAGSQSILAPTFIQIPNDIFDAIPQRQFTLVQRDVLDVVIRRSYGFHQDTADVSLSYISKRTGIAKSHVSVALKELVGLNVLTRDKGRYGHTYRVLPVAEWLVLIRPNAEMAQIGQVYEIKIEGQGVTDHVTGGGYGSRNQEINTSSKIKTTTTQTAAEVQDHQLSAPPEPEVVDTQEENESDPNKLSADSNKPIPDPFNDLIIPESLSRKIPIHTVHKRLKGISFNDAQTIIDEMVGNLKESEEKGYKINSVQSYFNYLIKCYRNGNLSTERAVAIQKRRQEHAEAMRDQLARKRIEDERERKERERLKRQKQAVSEHLSGLSESAIENLKETFIATQRACRSLAWDLYKSNGWNNKFMAHFFEKWVYDHQVCRT
ncbi:replication protein [Magnetococcales bacterium HHB-1]